MTRGSGFWVAAFVARSVIYPSPTADTCRSRDMLGTVVSVAAFLSRRIVAFTLIATKLFEMDNAGKSWHRT